MRRRRRGSREVLARAVIVDPDDHTVMDARGAVRSVQAAELELPAPALEAIWNPMHLERLARTYWLYLSRVTLGLIRVRYTPGEREVVLVSSPLVLLRFHAPDYEMSAERGRVRWCIMDGLLVARRDQGHLEIAVRRRPGGRDGFARAHVEVEVANFYPAIALWLARGLYQQTQSRIHVLVTHGFLRSLARLELEESAVRRFAPAGASAPGPGEGADRWSAGDGSTAAGDRSTATGEAVTVGDTPWAVIAGLAAAALVVAAAGRRRSSES